MNETRTLIVNADDGGYCEEGDEHLFELMHCGAITSVSVLANGRSLDSFVRQWKAFTETSSKSSAVGLGLHFNLTEGRALGGPYKTLTDQEGLFLGPKETTWNRGARDEIDPQEVAQEATLQWNKLCELGLQLDHLDSHNHIHLYPCVSTGLALALGHKELFLRAPDCLVQDGNGRPAFPSGALFGSSLREFHKQTSWRFCDRFVGFAFSDCAKLDALSLLGEAGALTTEWMVHPTPHEFSSFGRAANRQEEFLVVKSPELVDCLTNWGYELRSFGSLL